MKFYKNYKWLLLSALFVICFGLVSGVNAYLSDGDKATNELIIGGVRTEIAEEFDPPEKLEPGISFTKDVKVTNVGPSACYVRAKAVFTDSDMEKYCTVDWNLNDYDYNATDGYYYYKNKLQSGETTPSLFTTVTLSDSITANEIKNFDILVYTECYQSNRHDNYQDAWAEYHKNRPE